MGVLVNVVLGELWYTALPTFKLLIAIPNDLPVSVVAVPDLWSIPTEAVGALDLAKEHADQT